MNNKGAMYDIKNIGKSKINLVRHPYVNNQSRTSWDCGKVLSQFDLLPEYLFGKVIPELLVIYLCMNTAWYNFDKGFVRVCYVFLLKTKF